jgi:hypothetical protein
MKTEVDRVCECREGGGCGRFIVRDKLNGNHVRKYFANLVPRQRAGQKYPRKRFARRTRQQHGDAS